LGSHHSFQEEDKRTLSEIDLEAVFERAGGCANVVVVVTTVTQQPEATPKTVRSNHRDHCAFTTIAT
jgi:hypothetical protein